MLPFSKTSKNNLNYLSILNIREVIKFCNLGDQGFQTDFEWHAVNPKIPSMEGDGQESDAAGFCDRSEGNIEVSSARRKFNSIRHLHMRTLKKCRFQTLLSQGRSYFKFGAKMYP